MVNRSNKRDKTLNTALHAAAGQGTHVPERLAAERAVLTRHARLDDLTGIGNREVDVQAMTIVPASGHWRRDDNFVATIRYADPAAWTVAAIPGARGRRRSHQGRSR